MTRTRYCTPSYSILHVAQVAGDMLYDQGFDIGQVLKYFAAKKGDLAIYYELEPEEDPQRRGIIEVDPASNRCL